MPSDLLDAIYISTSAVADLLGEPIDNIYAEIRRKGGGNDFRGITLRKVNKRIYFPAAEIRALMRPQHFEVPNGVDVFEDFVAAVVPEISRNAAHHLGVALFGSERTLGWKPAPGQLDPSRLKQEIGLAAMLVQSLLERIDQAEAEAGRRIVDAEVEWMVHVLQWALRWRGGGSVGGLEKPPRIVPPGHTCNVPANERGDA